MKKHINLYHPIFYPKREKATFSQFVLFSFICLSASVFIYFYVNQQTDALNQQLSTQKQSLVEQQQVLSELVIALQKSRAPQAKLSLYNQLQEEMKAKQRLLVSLSGIDLQESVSFSELMRGLSFADTADVSLHHFSMTDGILNISGAAKQSDSVPLWLSNMQLTQELSSVAFKALSITENEGIFSFQLSNIDAKGKVNE